MTAEQISEAVARYVARERVDWIAADYGVTSAAIIYHARSAGVSRRQQFTRRSVCAHCAKEFEFIAAHAKRSPRLFCSVPCRTAGYRGRIHGNYKVGESIQADGYRQIAVPEGHATRTRRGKQKNRAPEHVIVVEKALGRPLRQGEVVHHINGDKLDNCHCNLLLCADRYHKELHQRMGEFYMRDHFPRVAVA